jgi:hypothetical protein
MASLEPLLQGKDHSFNRVDSLATDDLFLFGL